jgi:hypothetical protein
MRREKQEALPKAVTSVTDPGVRSQTAAYKVVEHHGPLDDEGRRLLAIFEALRAEEMAAAQLISHPRESVLYQARMKMLADLADLRAKRSAAATAFREHSRTLRQKEK